MNDGLDGGFFRRVLRPVRDGRAFCMEIGSGDSVEGREGRVATLWDRLQAYIRILPRSV